MSGRRISKNERTLIAQGRRYVKRARQSEFTTLGNNAESTRYQREVAIRFGKAGN